MPKLGEEKFEKIQVIRSRTIKYANSPLCACRGSTGQKS